MIGTTDTDVEPFDCGHLCCDDRGDPYHDHFLTPAQCRSCGPTLEVDDLGQVTLEAAIQNHRQGDDVIVSKFDDQGNLHLSVFDAMGEGCSQVLRADALVAAIRLVMDNGHRIANLERARQHPPMPWLPQGRSQVPVHMSGHDDGGNDG